jgi:hypothetical protein
MAYFRYLAFCLFLVTHCKPKERAPAALPAHLETAAVLCFHDVGREGRYAISMAGFNAILDLLDEYRVVSLADWVAGNNPEDSRMRVVLTFDDG